MKKFNYLQPSLSFVVVFEIVTQNVYRKMYCSNLCLEINYSSSFVAWNVKVSNKLFCITTATEIRRSGIKIPSVSFLFFRPLITWQSRSPRKSGCKSCCIAGDFYCGIMLSEVVVEFFYNPQIFVLQFRHLDNSIN